MSAVQQPSASAPHVVVVGASAFGGWTALRLRNLGAKVTLVDAWGPGNARASSGGDSRVIRAVYGPDRIYVEMVKRSYQLWENLDASTDESLYTETGALWLHRGDDSYVQSSASILRELNFPLEKLSIEDAKGKYPQINFAGIKSVWLERRAGALSAGRACAVVRDAFVQAGGRYLVGEARAHTILDRAMKSIGLTNGKRLEADIFVFACGPWLGRLFPDEVGDRVKPTRQEVFYFGTPPGSDQYLPGRLPVWIDFGERIFYGIPDIHGRGFKIADDTRGEAFEPTRGDRSPSEAGVLRARQLLTERFPEMAKAPLIHAEVCQYENSPDGHLIMDRLPGAENVFVLGGGSGHGFKLSPAVGEMTAQAILSDKKLPAMFSLSRLKDPVKPATQFESKSR